MNEFMKLPLWFSIPLIAAYVAIMGYVLYIIWKYRK